uniref:Uncharacterized protein n=1 Tax=Rhizophora mucronata TaxID=61149 RepID=A0A2P2N1C0_RHIMU
MNESVLGIHLLQLYMYSPFSFYLYCYINTQGPYLFPIFMFFPPLMSFHSLDIRIWAH